MDVAFTPQARSLSGAKDWTHRPKAAVGRAMQGAARQATSPGEHVGEQVGFCEETLNGFSISAGKIVGKLRI